jgi:hypothetical protein
MSSYRMISIQYKQKSYYCLWYSFEQEGLVCKQGKLLTYLSPDRLRADARTQGLEVEEGLAKHYNLDDLSDFIEDCERPASGEALDAWSLFNDLAFSLQTDFAGGGANFQINAIYEKLCLSSLYQSGEDDFSDLFENPPDDRFDLTSEEEEMTKAVLQTGIEMFEKNKVVIE